MEIDDWAAYAAQPLFYKIPIILKIETYIINVNKEKRKRLIDASLMSVGRT